MESNVQHQHQQQHQHEESITASGISLLLSDWSKFGLPERTYYHFDLINTLLPRKSSAAPIHAIERTTNAISTKPVAVDDSDSNLRDETSNSCGVIRLLECVPSVPLNKRNRGFRKRLKGRIGETNRMAKWASTGGSRSLGEDASHCHQPFPLPLALSPMTRMTFAYDLTRIAFCVDASPTLTYATFGDVGSGSGLGSSRGDSSCCCSLDRLPWIAKTFFSGLVKPVAVSNDPVAVSMEAKHTWNPQIAVTVLAVYSSANVKKSLNDRSKTSVLVKDYRIHDLESAAALSDMVSEWISREVESEISSRMNNGHDSCGLSSTSRFRDLWTANVSSSLRDILGAADCALESLPHAGRPCIVIATDCQSILCDNIIDTIKDKNRVDIPTHILDLSSPKIKTPTTSSTATGRNQTANNPSPPVPWYLAFDHVGTPHLPITLTDDSAALFNLCQVTDGFFFDSKLLSEATTQLVGNISPESVLSSDYYVTHRRRAFFPNVLQWYALCHVSPLTPVSSTNWKPAPDRVKITKSIGGRHVGVRNADQGRDDASNPTGVTRDSNDVASFHSEVQQRRKPTLPSLNQPSSGSVFSTNFANNKHRTTFSTYSLSPIHVKGILWMRFFEGFRVKQYGYNTQDTDKVSIHFTLPLSLGITLHYELSFVSSPSMNHNPLVGNAHVKLELSGNPFFIQTVKNDFTSHVSIATGMNPSNTVSRRESMRLCEFLRWIRKEDVLESYIIPLNWRGDILDQDRSGLFRRLSTLSSAQKYRHFAMEVLDILCLGGTKQQGSVDPTARSGKIPTDAPESRTLFVNTHYSPQADLADCITKWSTQRLSEDGQYIKILSPTTQERPTAYCIIQMKQSIVSQIFVLSIGVFGLDANDQLSLMHSFRSKLSSIDRVVILPKRLPQYITRPIGSIPKENSKFQWMKDYCHFDHWDLQSDPELFPLIKQRRDIENFWLVDTSQTIHNYAVFVKYVTCDENGKPVDISQNRMKFHRNNPNSYSSRDVFLLQYQVCQLQNHVSVDVYTDIPKGTFPSFLKHRQCHHRDGTPVQTIFQKIKEQDGECCRALRGRSRLLRFLQSERDPPVPGVADLASDVERLLAHSNSISKPFRFFHQGAGLANDILVDLISSFMLSGSLEGAEIVKLCILPTEELGDASPGLWFLIRPNSHILCLANIPLAGNRSDRSDAGDTEKVTHRDVCFFTFGIRDLYRTKQDKSDDRCFDGDRAEHLNDVYAIVNALEEEHGRNYARAIYLGLRRNTDHEHPMLFHSDDLSFGLGFCSFTNIAEAYVTKPLLKDAQGSYESLLGVIGSLFKPIPGGNNTFLYFSGTECQDSKFEQDVNEEIRQQALGSEILIMSSDDTISEGEYDGDALNDGYSHDDGSNDLHIDEVTSLSDRDAPFSPSSQDLAKIDFSVLQKDSPLFAQVELDGRIVSIDELSSMTEGHRISILVTVFGHGIAHSSSFFINDTLPIIHTAVSQSLRLKLNSYVASQTLERLANLESLSDVDLKVAMKCLAESNNVASATVPVSFYLAKSESLVLASNTNESELGMEYSKLLDELSSGMRMTKTRNDSFYVTSDLAFGSFVRLHRKRGLISVHAYHPWGAGEAGTSVIEIEDKIRTTCHRVNQLLLLESLHLLRQASFYLLPKVIDLCDSASEIAPDSSLDAELPRKTAVEDIPKDDLGGYFACPMIFQATFLLNHRVTTSQAIIGMESSILHPFAVSNRDGVFVYKDEEGNIFYMMLCPRKNPLVKSDVTDEVKLLVFGLYQPGPSITKQLCRLLEKKILSTSVEALSSVLTKNPQFPLLPVDTAFLKSFGDTWTHLESEDSSGAACVQKKINCCREYEFPQSVYDPVLIMLYFRQNLCGSTYFHCLHESGGSDETHPFSYPQEDNVAQGIDVQFDPSCFSIYFNNAPSPLDPDIQPVSTLTVKGEQYCRQTGNGIALINLTILEGNIPVKNISIGADPDFELSRYEVPLECLRFRHLKDDQPASSRFSLRIDIINTTLNIVSLHEWIELTLNQVLVGWIIERHLQRSRMKLFIVEPTEIKTSTDESHTWNQSQGIDTICPGLPALWSMLNSSYALPTLAVERLDSRHLLKSTPIVELAYTLLELAILRPLYGDNNQMLSTCSVIMFGSDGSTTPKQISMSRDAQNNKVQVLEYDTGLLVDDKETDSSEYICAFGLWKETKNTDATPEDPKSPKLLFREVIVNIPGFENKNHFSQVLSWLKGEKTCVFRRSLSFILYLGRSFRTLLVYNCNAHTFKDIKYCFLNIEESAIKEEKYNLRPGIPLDEAPAQEKGANSLSKPQQLNKIELVTEKQCSDPGILEPRRRKKVTGVVDKIRKQTLVVRRPKLIGQSVEGAAMQAQKVARARASSRPSMIARNPSSGMTRSSSKKGFTGSTRQSRASVRSDDMSDVSSIGYINSFTDADNEGVEKHVEKHVPHLTLKNQLPPNPKKVPLDVDRLFKNSWLSGIEQYREEIESLAYSVKTFSCPLLPLVDEEYGIDCFLQFYTQILLDSIKDSSIIGTNTPTKNRSIYMKIILKGTSTTKGTGAILELSTKRTPAIKNDIVTCRLFLFLGIGSNHGQFKNRTESKRACGIEKKSASTDLLWEALCSKLCLRSEVYNFAVKSLLTAIQSKKSIGGNFTALMQDMTQRFPLRMQKRMPRLRQRIYKQIISPSTLLMQNLSTVDLGTLLSYMGSNDDAYNIIDISDTSNKCLVCPLKGSEIPVAVFIVQGEKMTCEIFILCDATGGMLDAAVIDGTGVVAMDHSERIISAAENMVNRILNAGVINLHRDLLWKKFLIPIDRAAGDSPSFYDLNDLRRESFEISILNLDKRLNQMINLCKENQVHLNWALAFGIMRSNSIFSHSLSFQNEKIARSHYSFGYNNLSTKQLFSFQGQDMLLLFEVEDNKHLILANLLVKEDKSRYIINRKNESVESLITWLVDWIWHYI